MMSNGPRSRRRSVHIGARSNCDVRAVAQDPDARGSPPCCSPRSERLQIARAGGGRRARRSRGPDASRCAPGRRLGGVEHDRDREQVVLARDPQQRGARLALDVGGVDHGQPPARAAAARRSRAAPRTRPRSPTGRCRRRPRARGRSRWRRPRSAGSAAPRTCSCPSRSRPSARPRTGSGSSILIARTPPSGSAARRLHPPGRPAGSARGSRGGRRPVRPRGELRPRPLEAVVGVAERAGRERLPQPVVLGVGRRDDDGLRAGRSRTRSPRTPPAAADRSARSPRPARPRRTRPAAGRGRSAGSVSERHAVAQAALGELQRAGGDVDAHHERRSRRSTRRWSSAPAPQPRSTTRRAPDALSTAWTAPSRWSRSEIALLERLLALGDGRPVDLSQIAPGDQLALGMRGQPVAAAAQQLLDLGLVDPVVLLVVEHRQQHVEVLSSSDTRSSPAQLSET